ncbi:hypothetical protein AAG906_008406 [Vitis piasezkii]
MLSSFCIQAVFLLMCFGLATHAIEGNETYRLALLDFKAKITEDPLGIMRSWNESVHFCQWSGVTCGRQHQKVTVLDLHSQQLVGLISPHIGNLSFIRVLLLQNNSFNGEIPQEVGRLGRLETLRLDSNSLDGEIPSNISSCSNLISLTIGFNSVVGKLPEELGSLSMLQFLAVQRNNLSGSIPPSFGNLSSLGKFSATQNNLVGSIPDGNQLTGKVPSLEKLNQFAWLSRDAESIGSISIMLAIFLVDNNHIYGGIPTGIVNLVNLDRLEVWNNQLSGNIPSDIGKLQELDVLIFNGNNFSGTTPSSVDNEINNTAPENIPPQVVSFSSLLIYLGLSQNYLTGPLPIELLSMQGNSFQGSIPSSFSLNLSYNNFVGEVPIKGVFKNASATSIVGNSQLSGGIPEFQLPRCIFKEPKKGSLSLAVKIIISTVSGILGIGFVLAFLIFYRLNKKRREPISSSSEKSLLKVSYQSLLWANDGFSSSNLIGVGSFGSVYRGILVHDGTVIAVKVLNLLRKGVSKSFIAECEVLRNIRHRNLVKVLTACSGADYQACMLHSSFPTAMASFRPGRNETDRLALLAFKAKITYDPSRILRSWNGSIHFGR